MAFIAIEALCAFPWGRISAARVLPVVDEVTSSPFSILRQLLALTVFRDQYCFTPKDKLPLAQVIVTRIVQVLSAL